MRGARRASGARYNFGMARRLRFALLWLLLLALPLQGYAAAVGLHCGQQPGPKPHHASAGLSAVAPACHGAAAVAGSAAVAAVAANHTDAAAKLKCSVCAACCHAAALAPPALTFESMPPVTRPDSFVAVSVLGFFTDGPDRPPRHFSC